MTIPTFPARPVNGGPWPAAAALPRPGTWAFEPKYNGWRTLVHVPTGTMFNRHGQRLSIEDEFAPALDCLRRLDLAPWLDCEALERRHGIGRGCLIVLDIPVPTLTYTQRRHIVERVRRLDCEDFMEPGIYCPPSFEQQYATDVWEKLQLRNQRLGADFYEGLVAKRTDSTYPVQTESDSRTFPGWVKHRWAF